MAGQKRPLGVQISRALKARGVEVVFGIPGVHNIELYRGLEEAGLTHVLARHEQGAGFMADGYARATGKPGVAYVITGPGLCNILTPLGQAYSDSVPMLVISSCLDETGTMRGQLHQMKDQRLAAECVCDWSEEASEAATAFDLLDRAMSEFRTARPRPKHIQVPIACLGTEADPAPPPDTREHAQAETGLPVAAQADIEAVAARLATARRPLVIFGGGAARDPGAVEPARALVAAMGAAVFLTYAARGLIASDDPLCFGATLPRPSSAGILASADLVITIGSELAEVDLWRNDPGHKADLLRVDIDDDVLNDRHAAAMKVKSDARSFISALLARLRAQGHTAASGWQKAEIRAHRAAARAAVDAERPGIVPIVDALKAALPPQTLIYSDMTQFAYVAKEVFDMDSPGLWHHPTGFGTLGYALPAAIGGKIGAPERPVLAIAGDYGFHYTMQELGVAAELGLSLPILLWDNARLKEIEDSMIAAQIPPRAVAAKNPDFCSLARAFGAMASRPASLADMQADIASALQRPGPSLIHVTPDIL